MLPLEITYSKACLNPTIICISKHPLRIRADTPACLTLFLVHSRVKVVTKLWITGEHRKTHNRRSEEELQGEGQESCWEWMHASALLCFQTICFCSSPLLVAEMVFFWCRTHHIFWCDWTAPISLSVELCWHLAPCYSKGRIETSSFFLFLQSFLRSVFCSSTRRWPRLV